MTALPHKLAALSVLLALAATGVSRASLIWSGAPSGGLGVFRVINLEDANKVSQPNPSANGSSITAVNDATYGSVWQFAKASADLRSEAHGAAGFNPAIGSTYYIGFRFKINSTVTDNAIFQWKAYGSPMTQNYPIVLKYINGALQLHQYQPGSTNNLLWSLATAPNTWRSIVLKIKVSDQTTGGQIQFWYGGDSTPETLLTGGTSFNCRTFDGTSVDPKWGIYGAVGTQVTNLVGQIKIGTTYADVAP